MNLNMNINSNAARTWRSAVFTGSEAVEVDSISKSQSVFQLLTTMLLMYMLDPRNAVPFYELPVYRKRGRFALTAKPNYGQATDTSTIVEAEKKLSSQQIRSSAVYLIN